MSQTLPQPEFRDLSGIAKFMFIGMIVVFVAGIAVFSIGEMTARRQDDDPRL
jgi:hypothetical protein